MYHFQGNRDHDTRNDSADRRRPRNFNARHEATRRDRFRRPPPPRTAAERPLFRLRHEEVENASFLDPHADSKFRNLEELTDSDEEAMALSDDEEPERDTKRARVIEPDTAAVATVPKWSNPDPYTSLPPLTAGESTAKHTDVLKLIRKARIDSSRSQTASSADDFISFSREGSDAEDAAPPAASSTPPQLDGAMGVQSSREEGSATEGKVLGKRKRGQTIGSQPPRQSSHNKIYGDSRVQKRWAVVEGIALAPWLTESYGTDIPGIALHKEIIDFYDWVKPKDFEQQVRASVFRRLGESFAKCMKGELKAFGSYAAGLYLPTADMDLVYLTSNYRPGRLPTREDGRRVLPHFSRHLRMNQIAKPNSIVVISGAKVPIIKFVDRVSGLKVDLSFDNDSGIVAIDTFQKWKKEYPAMPVIVAIIKQFLMIRGLNDVATGGLGGFSTICLVTSLLQHMPPIKQRMNLGEVLLEFFNLYGNVFDKDSVIIRLEPPGYVDKRTYMPTAFRDKDGRLTIVDPNRPDNNISGGTRLIDDIINCFSLAHQTLLSRLESYGDQSSQGRAQSLLECLIGGNFTMYETQRQIMFNLSPAGSLIPPSDGSNLPPRPIATVKGEPTTVAGPSKKQKTKPSVATKEKTDTKMKNSDSSTSEENSAPRTKKANKSEKRANRLKRLRPDLAPLIRRTITKPEAVRLGGYTSQDAMERDLQAREAAMQKAKAK
ncbi:hypothetical protein A1O1_03628 [Capronia coronata CBS 617.96]|uniref:polynucleotide adenylyltransferase n=1 Tax=Capronia coronata CBS 617.96 TaxID=1182541 RepID=W9YLH5_9EURO|nr:uncharacterized protein A1O1_03628 [Capronia coronata CBS 617.96]EXJ90525.1 hypothetical protein A1O1_03628 [Capronia coronata CBS 617.96]